MSFLQSTSELFGLRERIAPTPAVTDWTTWNAYKACRRAAICQNDVESADRDELVMELIHLFRFSLARQPTVRHVHQLLMAAEALVEFPEIDGAPGADLMNEFARHLEIGTQHGSRREVIRRLKETLDGLPSEEYDLSFDPKWFGRRTGGLPPN